MKNQYYPFDDFLSLTISVYGPDGEELPWREVAERMREIPREKKSEILAHLTRVFRKELEHNGEVKALERFWQKVKEMRAVDLLTDEMEKVLLDAKAGNIKSAQIMVRANPYVIHLPFIAKAMSYVVSQHKYCDAKIDKDKDEGKTVRVLFEVSGVWREFLPKRAGGDVTYSHADLKRLLLLAEKQMRNEKKLSPRGKEVPVVFDDVRKEVAEALKISAEYLKKNIKTKSRKDDPELGFEDYCLKLFGQ